MDLFTAGNAAYESKKYAEAISSYEQILTSDYVSKELFLNLGNAYYQSDNLAKSILNYERGLKLAPNNKDLINNLEIAKDKVDSDILEVQPFVLLRWWRSLSLALSLNLWTILQLAFLALIAYSVFLLFNRSEAKQRQPAFLALAVLIPLFIITSLLLVTRNNLMFDKTEAIVLDNSDLLEGADERSESLSPLKEGEKVFITDKVDQWYKIRLSNQQIGWMSEKNLEII